MAEKINSDEISLSGVTPSLNRASSYGLSSVSQSKNSKYDQKYEKMKANKRPSIAEALKI